MNRAQRRYLDATVRPGTRGRSHTSPTSWAQNDAQWFKANGNQSHQAVGPRPQDVPDLDMAAVRTSADLVATQQPHGDVRAAIRRAKRLFKVWLDHEARS